MSSSFSENGSISTSASDHEINFLLFNSSMEPSQVLDQFEETIVRISPKFLGPSFETHVIDNLKESSLSVFKKGLDKNEVSKKYGMKIETDFQMDIFSENVLKVKEKLNNKSGIQLKTLKEPHLWIRIRDEKKPRILVGEITLSPERWGEKFNQLIRNMKTLETLFESRTFKEKKITGIIIVNGSSDRFQEITGSKELKERIRNEGKMFYEFYFAHVQYVSASSISEIKNNMEKLQKEAKGKELEDHGKLEEKHKKERRNLQQQQQQEKKKLEEARRKLEEEIRNLEDKQMEERNDLDDKQRKERRRMLVNPPEGRKMEEENPEEEEKKDQIEIEDLGRISITIFFLLNYLF